MLAIVIGISSLISCLQTVSSFTKRDSILFITVFFFREISVLKVSDESWLCNPIKDNSLSIQRSPNKDFVATNRQLSFYSQSFIMQFSRCHRYSKSKYKHNNQLGPWTNDKTDKQQIVEIFIDNTATLRWYKCSALCLRLHLQKNLKIKISDRESYHIFN